MGAASSTSQNITTYNKLTNTININAKSSFMNNAVMESIKKSMITLNQNCTQKFDSNAVIQLSNLSSIGDVSITDLTLDSKNVVKFDCVVQSQLLSQTENNFLSDNSASMASMLQSVGTTDFVQSISGSLKNKIDSMPLSFSSASNNQSSTNIIDTQTSQNIVQEIQNLYKSTNVDDTTIKTVNDTYQGFVNNAKIIVNNVTAGGNIKIAAIRLDTINQLDATAKLAAAVSQVVLQKMQTMLGMKIQFQTDTAQQSTTSNTTDTNASSTTTVDSVTNVANNAISSISSIIGAPFKIVAIVIAIVIVLLVLFVLYKLFSNPQSTNQTVQKLLIKGKNNLDNTLVLDLNQAKI